MDDDTADDENPALGWPKNDRPAAPQEGLFVSDVELYRRLGVGPRTGKIAVRALEPAGFPEKDRLWGNKRYWPAVRVFLDHQYIGPGLNRPPAAALSWKENFDAPRGRARPKLEAANRRLTPRTPPESK